ncbi:cytochrome P450 [Lindgomyces ingoldianus]|uniref:Cytochrome P450 n=1 Tax=Lindgomyces ingoldianus TaxID=673940 RepID=A0ACB6Q793_9PLEO|nr:cytochrome P450 [Lindgomyces ingoldianus]KAF2462686.1 cytochrome P450 [Lindgomyces ingoldianus]
MGDFCFCPLHKLHFKLHPGCILIEEREFKIYLVLEKKHVDRVDISHWLISASLKKGLLQADKEWLNGDAVTIIIARSDTIAPTLFFDFYELSRSPEQQEILLAELRNVDVFDHNMFQRCEHLSALINETVRLHPPVPASGYRQSPPTGIMINQTYVPGNVTIVAARYSLARLESAFEYADQFVLERWTTKPHIVKDPRGFAPFSQGRFNCVVKTPAMREMRLVIAMIVKRFQRLLTDLRDHFAIASSPYQ